MVVQWLGLPSHCAEVPWCSPGSSSLFPLHTDLYDWVRLASFHSPCAIHKLSFLGPLLIDTNHFTSGIPYKASHFRDALTQSSHHHNLVLVKYSHLCQYFSVPVSTLRTVCLLAARYIPPLDRCYCNEIINNIIISNFNIILLGFVHCNNDVLLSPYGWSVHNLFCFVFVLLHCFHSKASVF